MKATAPAPSCPEQRGGRLAAPEHRRTRVRWGEPRRGPQRALRKRTVGGRNIADYHRAAAISLPPTNDQAVLLGTLAIEYLALGRSAEALQAAWDAVELNPTYEGAQMSLSSALVETGSAGEDIAAYRAVQDAGVADTMAQANNLARSLYFARHYEAALPIMEEWLAAHPTPSGDQYYELDTMAHLQAALGHTTNAVQTFKRALKVGGPDLQAHYEARLTELGFPREPGGAGLKAALQAYVATGAGCRISP